jgi:hypothetical protein
MKLGEVLKSRVSRWEVSSLAMVCASSDGERRISISHQPTSPFYSRQALASTPNVLKKSPGFDFQLV